MTRQLWIVEVGVFLNMLGYGAVFPFEIIYLHEQRGFDLGTAGLVAGLVSGAALVSAPLAGTIVDRIGARPTAVASGVALAVGYASLAFVTTPTMAVVSATLAGIGNGGLQPSQSALMAALAPREVFQRVSAISRVAVNFGIGLGAAIGGVMAGLGVDGFVILFLANAVTYLIYVIILAVAVRTEVRPEPLAGGYREVFRDRILVRFALINVAMIAVGWGVLAWIIPPYASGIGVSPSLIGLLLLANAATVVVAQVPIVKAAEGRTRVGALSGAAIVWVAACLLALAAQVGGAAVAFIALTAAAIAFAVGECLHATVFMPLLADLAPPARRGRYMATGGLSWWLGLALAPTLGGQLSSLSPALALIAAAGVSSAVVVLLRPFGRALPADVRLVPEPERRPTKAAT